MINFLRSHSADNCNRKGIKKRIDIIDALRGLAVALMVIHHLLYDLVEFLGAPEWLFTNPVFDVLHYIFVAIFIGLSGVSSQLTRSNIKRGLKVLALALGITIVTYLMDVPIIFGILHLLGFCMLFYGLTRKLWDALPRKIAPALYIALIIGGVLATRFYVTESEYLWIFGWIAPGFVSYDYFPLLPWLFVFLLGTWAGVYIAERKLPDWFYNTKIPLLPAIGKRALLIYILHQPILYGVVMAIAYFK